MVVLLRTYPDFRQQMQARMPDDTNWDDVLVYWGRRVQWGHLTTYRLVVELSEGLRLHDRLTG